MTVSIISQGNTVNIQDTNNSVSVVADKQQLEINLTSFDNSALAATYAAEASASATEASLYDGPKVDTFAELSSVTPAMLGIGEYIRVVSTNAVYQRVSSGGDLDYSGFSGVRLNVVPLQNTITTQQFGILGDGTDETAKFKKFASAIKNGIRGVISNISGSHILVTSAIVFNAAIGAVLEGNAVTIKYDDATASTSGSVVAMKFVDWTLCQVSKVNLDMVNQASQQTGISLNGSSYFTKISNCKVNNARWVGISIADETAAGSSIEFCEISYCRFGAYLGGKNSQIKQCEIFSDWANTAEGIANGGVWSAPSLYYDGIIVPEVSGVQVVENHIWGCGQSGIYAEAMTDSFITGNRIHNNYNKGIDIGPSTGRALRVIVSDNNVTYNVTGNIHFYNCDQSLISGNVLQSSGLANGFGVGLNGSSQKNLIQGNIINITDAFSIFVNNATGATNNQVTNDNKIIGTGSVSVDKTSNEFFSRLYPVTWLGEQTINITGQGFTGASSRRVMTLAVEANDGVAPNTYAQIVSNLPVRFTDSSGNPHAGFFGSLQGTSVTVTTSLYISPSSWLQLPTASQTVEGRVWYDSTLKLLRMWDGTRGIKLSENVEVGNSSATPSAASDRRGKLFLLDNGAGVSDSLQVCIKDSSGAYLWKTVSLT